LAASGVLSVDHGNTAILGGGHPYLLLYVLAQGDVVAKWHSLIVAAEAETSLLQFAESETKSLKTY
jgi:hypothetical protein